MPLPLPLPRTTFQTIAGAGHSCVNTLGCSIPPGSVFLEKILERKREKIWEKALGGKGGKDLNREGGGGKDLGEEKREDFRGGKGLGGKGGKDLNRERGEKILGRKREKISGGGKASGGKGGERISTGQGGTRS